MKIFNANSVNSKLENSICNCRICDDLFIIFLLFNDSYNFELTTSCKIFDFDLILLYDYIDMFSHL